MKKKIISDLYDYATFAIFLFHSYIANSDMRDTAWFAVACALMSLAGIVGWVTMSARGVGWRRLRTVWYVILIVLGILFYFI